jgi:molybdopterin adenylyltransferase
VYNAIEKSIIALADKCACNLIITTSETGPAARDITPEATVAACGRMQPEFGELMRAESLIINLPGKPKAIQQCLDTIFPAIPNGIKLLGEPEINCCEKNSHIYHQIVQ